MALLELLVSVAIVLSSISGIGEFSSQFKYTLTLGVKLFGSFQKIMMLPPPSFSGDYLGGQKHFQKTVSGQFKLGGGSIMIF